MYVDPKKLGSIWNKIHKALTPQGAFLGSFFDHGSTCKWSFGAWTLDGVDTINKLIKSKPNTVKHCDYRKKVGGSSIIEFVAEKING